MSDEIIFHEVDEELRRDRMQTAWRRYGPFVIGGCVAVILLVAASEGWSWWQSSNAARSSDQFYAALDAGNNGDIAGATKALDLVIAQGSGQYPVLARFAEAGLLVKQGKTDDALKAYDDLANTATNTRLRELALLSGANLLVDKGDVPGVKQRITGLLASDNPLRNSARETLGLAQYKSGDLNGARDSFAAILNDPTSSDETRGRVQVYVGQLTAEGAAAPPAATAAGNAADLGAAAVSAASGASGASSAAAPAASNGGEAPASASTDSGGPAGISASQPMTPDAAVQLAVPAAPTAPAAPSPDAQPIFSTGAGLPTPSPAATPDATAPAAAAPATPAASAPTPAPTAPETAAPAPATPASGTTTAPANDNATPAPATGTTGQ